MAIIGLVISIWITWGACRSGVYIQGDSLIYREWWSTTTVHRADIESVGIEGSPHEVSALVVAAPVLRLVAGTLLPLTVFGIIPIQGLAA